MCNGAVKDALHKNGEFKSFRTLRHGKQNNREITLISSLDRKYLITKREQLVYPVLTSS